MKIENILSGTKGLSLLRLKLDGDIEDVKALNPAKYNRDTKIGIIAGLKKAQDVIDKLLQASEQEAAK
jgi:hypothetical protein